MKGTEEDLENSNLIKLLNRGGLWSLKPQAENIFTVVGKTFRSFTKINPKAEEC